MEEKTTKTARLFVALPVSDDIKRKAAVLPKKNIDARWTHPEDLHITLRFLGDLDPDRIPEITTVLQRVKHGTFFIDMAGMEAFYNKRQTILYAGVNSTRKLVSLCTDITDLLIPLGFDFGARPYVPHVTLARMKKARGLDDYIKRHGAGLKSQWAASEFYLMQSGAHAGEGRRYGILERFPLFA